MKKLLILLIVTIGLFACTWKNNPSNPGGQSKTIDQQEHINPNAVNGVLPGKFSVSASTKVQFSQGNLQYQASTNTWQFAERQYYMIGEANSNVSETNNGWIDLFGWGTGANPTKTSVYYNDYITFVDWGVNAISNGGNKANLWRTLSKDEWAYLFLTRANASALYGKSIVDSISGVIILPDDWQRPKNVSFLSGVGDDSLNTYSLKQWSIMESAGAVFLPCGGYRFGADVFCVGSYGFYWSSSPFGTNYADYLYFFSDDLFPHNYYRDSGYSVRLVR